MRGVFFHICESVLAMLGETPEDAALSNALRKIASMFARLQESPSQTLSGLIGELVFISMSKDPSLCISAWRNFDSDRYDFSTNNSKVEVKSSGVRRRSHEFSLEQCCAPEGSTGLVASIFVERSGAGSSVWDISELIEGRLGDDHSSIFKLRRIVAETLGNTRESASSLYFDFNLAQQSLMFFRFSDVPAVSQDTPVGVSGVRFMSDLSLIEAVGVGELDHSNEITLMMPSN